MGNTKINIIYNLLYQVLALIIPFITAPYISRELGVEGIGIFSYINSVSYYFLIFITLGLNNYGNRLVAKKRDNMQERSKAFWSVYSMQLLMGVIITILFFIYIFIFAQLEYQLFYLAYSTYVLSAIVDINWFFFGMTDFKFTTIRSSLIKLLTLVLIFVFVRGEYGLYKYFIIVGGTTFLSNALLWTKVKTYVEFYKPTQKDITQHIKPNIILFVPILAMSIYRVMDKIMINLLSDVIQTGYYENADKIISMSVTVFSAVATVMLPSVSNMVVTENMKKIKQLMSDVMQLSICLAFGISFGLISISKVFAPVFFGKEFYETGNLLIGLSITIVISAWKSVLRSQYLIPFEKDNAYVVSLIVGAVINIIINACLIGLYGARGAVIGTICAELVGAIIQTKATSSDIPIFPMIKDGSIFFIPAFIMCITVSLFLKMLPESMFSVILVVLVGILLYTVLSITFWCKYDFESFDRLLGKYMNKLKKVFTNENKNL